MVDYESIKQAIYGTAITLAGAGLIWSINYAVRWSHNNYTIREKKGLKQRRELSDNVVEADSRYNITHPTTPDKEVKE